MQFGNFFFDASCFSLITCDDEDAAFSIFDSLNTTGVPLTAIETLKPYVIRDYRTNNTGSFETSKAAKYLNYVDSLIRAPGNDDNKQKQISQELVVHAVLLGNGRVAGNDLNKQRIVIREMQQSCNSKNQKDLTSNVLRKIAAYRHNFSFIENIRNYLFRIQIYLLIRLMKSAL